MYIFTAPKRSLRRLCFYTCVSLHRGYVWQGAYVMGACVVGDMHGGGQGGMHGGEGCGLGGMCGRGHVWQGGACQGGHACHSRYYGIRSMNGRYASYWNAFLLFINCLTTIHKWHFLCSCILCMLFGQVNKPSRTITGV